MCLAIPMRVIEVDGSRGRVTLDRVTSDIRLDLVDAEIGDYVLVHAGYAIGVLDEQEALEVLALMAPLRDDPGGGS